MADRFMARQPIFDSRLKVFGYELLFRAGPENVFRPGQSPADEVIVNSTMLHDVKQLVGNALAFINVDTAALLREAPRLMAPGKVVVEILETVRITDEVVASCRALAKDHYALALDDFLDEPKWQPLIPCVRFLKVDFRLANHEKRRAIAQRYLPTGIRLLAEKVETEHELQEARSLGYGHFQGYFFCKPSMVRSRDIPSNRATCLRLLDLCGAGELDYHNIEALFRQEPSLTYRLLRYLNSAALPMRSEVHDVRQAVGLLGEREFRRWVAIVAMVMMRGNKPEELIRTALTRAHFCEQLARPLGLSSHASELFLMGLLSTVDALLDRPMPEVLAELSVSPEIRDALSGTGGAFGEVFDVLHAYEKADWVKLSGLANASGFSQECIPVCYLKAATEAKAISP